MESVNSLSVTSHGLILLCGEPLNFELSPVLFPAILTIFAENDVIFAGKFAFFLLPANCFLLPAMLVVADKVVFSVAGKTKCCRLSKIHVAGLAGNTAKARKSDFPCRCLFLAVALPNPG